MITSNKHSLIDTNILIYAADETSPFHQSARSLRKKGLSGELSLCVWPQIFNEFFAIVTDPKRVERPRTPKEALQEIEKYSKSKNIVKIYPGPGVIEITLDLLKKYRITKQNIFDLHLVATMITNNITRLYTYNQDDFSLFEEIEVSKP